MDAGRDKADLSLSWLIHALDGDEAELEADPVLCETH